MQSRLRSQLHRFTQDQSGATSIEYAVIAGGIAVVIIFAVNTLGVTVDGMYQTTNTEIQGIGN